MNKLVPLCGLAVGIVVIITASIVQGTWSERWSEHPELQEFANSLSKVPKTFGDWTSIEGAPMEARLRKAAGIVKDFSRVYQNNKTNEAVTVHMIAGRVVDVTPHTPDRCYPAAGFEKLGEIETVSLPTSDGKDAEFRVCGYEKKAPSGTESLQIFWTFASTGKWQKWQSPDSPRSEFVGAPAVYKMYIDVPLRSTDRSAGKTETPEKSVAGHFVKEFIPVLNKALFAASDKPSGAEAPLPAAK